MLQRAECELVTFYARVAAEERVQVVHKETARTPDVAFAPKVQDLVEKYANARGLSNRRIVSGAGHDCQEIAHIAPSGMVFVPGEYDGISHNPREFSTPKQCADGVNVLLDVVLELAEEGGP
jgi:N-carbamoyl-L-amino-acid hydrolase